MSTLHLVSESRDNNFNLIRFTAAIGVFTSHCFPLAGYSHDGKPQLLGFLCLNVFFIVSGFLVTKSYLFSDSLWQYSKSRMLRIFPALFLAILYSIFIIGLLWTSLPLDDYLSNSQIYIYFFKNIALLIPNIPQQLPGVFESSSYTDQVNVPLWSLPYELWFYIILAAIALLSSARKSSAAFSITAFTLLVLMYSAFVANYSMQTTRFAIVFDKETYRLGSFFLFGACFYLFRNKIELSHKVMCVLVLLVATSYVYRPAFVAVTYAVLVYAVFYFAYVPAGFLRRFNRLGDYSYGIYIFGYPTQQAIASTWPDWPFPIYCSAAFLITLTLAILSWHFVECTALKYKYTGSEKT